MKELEYYLENYNGTIGGVKPANTLNKNTDPLYCYGKSGRGNGFPDQTFHMEVQWTRCGFKPEFPGKTFCFRRKERCTGVFRQKALSEPESYAVATLTQQLIKKQNLQGVVNYHAMGRIIYGDCTKGSLKKDTYKMYDIAKKITGYSKAPDSGSGKSWGGQYREYVMDLLNKPSITIEIGSSVAPCPYWQYEIEFQKNRYVVVRIANALK